MPTVDHNIAEVNVEMVKGQGRSISFTDLLDLSDTVIGDWTAVAGPSGATALSVTADGTDVVVTWSDQQATSTLGKPWRLRWSGDDVAGGRVVEARPQETPGPTDLTITIQSPAPITVTVVGSGAGGASLSDADPEPLGAVDPGAATEAARADHVHSMPSAADVGADAAGSASAAVTAHVGAVDPHGDRAYADTQADAAQAAAEATAAAALAAHKSKIPHIQMDTRETAGPASPWRFVIDAPLRSAVYIPPALGTFPGGTFEGVELPGPDADSPSFGLVIETTGVYSTTINLYDVDDQTTVLGSVLDSVGSSAMSGANGLLPVTVYAMETSPGTWNWMAVSPPDGSLLSDAIVQIVGLITDLAATDAELDATKADVTDVQAALTGKEDEGVAADLVADLPEIAAGNGAAPDTATTGFIKLDRTATRIPYNTTAVSNTAAETSLLTSTVAVTDLQLDTLLHIKAFGNLTNNTGANRNGTISVKLGAIATAAFPFTAVPTSATGRTWRVDVVLSAISFIGNRFSADGTGILTAAGAGLDFGSVTVINSASGTFTLGQSLNLDISVTLSTNSTSLTASCSGGHIRRLRG